MTDKQPEMDLSRKFVRLIERRPDGFVEFEFAVHSSVTARRF